MGNIKITESLFIDLPNRHRDALVASVVMKLETHYVPMDYSSEHPQKYHWVYGPDGCPLEQKRIPQYTTDISAAWKVLEKMEDEDFWANLTRKTETHKGGPDEPEWHCRLRCVRGGTRGDHVANSIEAPLAICRAALKAVGEME